MRQIVIAIVVYVALNLFLPTLWDKFMTAAPDWALRVVLFLFALGCAAAVVFADPVYIRLAAPSKHWLASTLIVVGLTSSLSAAAWWFFRVAPSGDLLPGTALATTTASALPVPTSAPPPNQQAPATAATPPTAAGGAHESPIGKKPTPPASDEAGRQQRRLDNLLSDADDAPESLHTFPILVEPESAFAIGRCPNCLGIKLGALKPYDGIPEQELILRGGIFSFSAEKHERVDETGRVVGQILFGFHDEIIMRGGAFSVSPQDQLVRARLPLLPDADIQINTKKYRIRLVVIDTAAASLRIRAEVRAVKKAS